MKNKIKKTQEQTNNVGKILISAKVGIIQQTSEVFEKFINRRNNESLILPVTPFIYTKTDYNLSKDTIVKDRTEYSKKQYVCSYIAWDKDGTITLLDDNKKPMHEMQEIDIKDMVIVFSIVSAIADEE